MEINGFVITPIFHSTVKFVAHSMNTLCVVQERNPRVVVQCSVLHQVKRFFVEFVGLRVVKCLIHDALPGRRYCLRDLTPNFRVLSKFISFLQFIDPCFPADPLICCEHGGIVHIVDHVGSLSRRKKSRQIIDVFNAFPNRSLHILRILRSCVGRHFDVHPWRDSCLEIKVAVFLVLARRFGDCCLDFEG